LGQDELKLSDQDLELMSYGFVGQIGQKDEQRVENSVQGSILPQVVGCLRNDTISLQRLQADKS